MRGFGEPGFGQRWRVGPALIALVLLTLISPPLVIAAVLLALLCPTWLRDWRVPTVSALLGLLVLLSGVIGATWLEGWGRFFTVEGVHHRPDILVPPARRIGAGGDLIFLGWLVLLALAPAAGWVLDLIRPRRPREDAERRIERAARQEGRATRRAHRAAARRLERERTIKPPGTLHLGEHLDGDEALPVVDGAALLPREQLCQQTVVTGATGAGKTETFLRLIWECLRVAPDARIYYLDAKGDRRTAERFVWLMERLGRDARVFPNEPFSGWRGDWRALHNRLIEVIDYSKEGPASYYRDAAKAAVALACRHPKGVPGNSREFLRRLDYDNLSAAHGGHTGGLTQDLLKSIRLRYEAFFREIGAGVDGLWAWEDVDTAYLLLDSLALQEESEGLARFLFADFAHYFTLRKPTDQFCLLVVDEFSALARTGSMASRIEQARGFNTALLLGPQVADGMGDEREAARILGSVATVILHQMNTPEPMVELAGTHQAVEWSQKYEHGLSSGEGTARVQHQYKADPNEVRGFRPGEAYVISRGRAQRVLCARAPIGYATLPERTEARVGGLTAPPPLPAKPAVAREKGMPY